MDFEGKIEFEDGHEEIIPYGGTSFDVDYADREDVVRVKFPNSVKYIKYGSFEGCKNLVSVEFPSSLIEIGMDAFAGCESLVSISLPSKLKTIEMQAFAYCKKLTTVMMSESVTEIGYSAFTDCTALVDFTFPKNITEIPQEMFVNCESLKNIVIPSSVVSIGEKAFFGCDNLKIEVDDGNKRFSVRNNCLIENDTIIWGNKYSTIPCDNRIRKIGCQAFSGVAGLANIIIPQNITHIENCAFMGCYDLINITLQNSIQYIGEDSFMMCEIMQTITYKGKEKEWNLIKKGNLGRKLQVKIKGFLGNKTITVDALDWREKLDLMTKQTK